MSLQMWLMLRGQVKKDRMRLFLPPVTAIIFGSLSYLVSAPGEYLIYAIVFVFVTMVWSLLFIREIAPASTIWHTVAYTLLFWYVFGLGHVDGKPPRMDTWLLWLCALGSVSTFAALLFRGRVLALLKPLLYLWFLLALAYICAAQFSLGWLDLLAESSASMSDLFLVVLIGMGTTLLLSSVFLAYGGFFVLLAGFGYRGDRRAAAGLLAKFSEGTPAGYREPLLLFTLAVLGGMNYRFSFMPPMVFVDCCVVLAVLLIRTTAAGGQTGAAGQVRNSAPVA